MSIALSHDQIEQEVESAARLANQVKRPRGVHGIRVESDKDAEGNPMLIVSVDVDDDPDPSDERLDELLDYENELWSKITDGGLASWPLVRLTPRT
jgi:hypothetical protein